MKKLKWKTLESDILHQDKWIKIRTQKCETPQGVLVAPYYVIDYPNWVNALAFTDDGQVILVRIYRQGIEEVVLELPGGNVDTEDASPEATVQREFLEETGYAFDYVERVHEICPNPSNHSNRAYGFLLTGGKKVREPAPEEDESLEVVLMSLDEFKAILYQNKLKQAMHVTTAFYALRSFELKGFKLLPQRPFE